MLARILGQPRPGRGSDHQLDAYLYQMEERRTKRYIPYLKARIAELEGRIAQGKGG